jgi:hypothetical protein
MDAPKAGGNLRKNTRKEKDSHPDLTGKWTDQSGQQYWLSAWRNVDDKTGNVWFSLKLGAPVEQQSGGYESKKPALVQKPVSKSFADMDDDIPF